MVLKKFLFLYQVFTWYGATVEMDGTTETDYTADEVLHSLLFKFYIFSSVSWPAFTVMQIKDNSGKL